MGFGDVRFMKKLQRTIVEAELQKHYASQGIDITGGQKKSFFQKLKETAKKVVIGILIVGSIVGVIYLVIQMKLPEKMQEYMKQKEEMPY